MAKRAALTGILFVQRSGIPWEMLPQKMGCGSGMTCWRRLRDWHEAGVWHRIHQVLLDRLGEADQVDWSRASLDSASRYSSGVLILGLCPHLLELPSAGALLGALGREGGAVIESQSQVWKEAK